MKQYVQSADVVSRVIAGEHLLVPIRGNIADMDRLFALEGVAVYIWEQLGSPCTVESLAEKVVSVYDVPEECAVEDVTSLLKELERCALVSVEG